MTFKSPLGNELVQTFKFINFIKKPTVYNVKVEKIGQVKSTNPKEKAPPVQVDFYPMVQNNGTFQAAAADSYDGVECGIDIRYEPSNLGESRAVLIVSAPDGGEYQWPTGGAGLQACPASSQQG